MFPLLAPLRQRIAGRLSGGEQQMLAIARTLMGNPVAAAARRAERRPGADRRAADRRAVAAAARARRRRILIAEQNMHFCLGIASDATVIDKGQIVYRDTIDGLKANDAIRRRYLAL